jgi:hypothetical protein
MLTGDELLSKVKELGQADASKSDIVRICGYVSTNKDGTERLNFSKFYDAILDAKEISLNAEKNEDSDINSDRNIQDDCKIVAPSLPSVVSKPFGQLPGGIYWIGDLSYVCEDFFKQGLAKLEGIHSSKNGHPFAIYSTACGDGIFEDNEGDEYGVDVANIGCIPIAAIDHDSHLGHLVRFFGPFACQWIEDGGFICFGDLAIKTDSLSETVSPITLSILQLQALANGKTLLTLNSDETLASLQPMAGLGDDVESNHIFQDIQSKKASILAKEMSAEEAIEQLLQEHGIEACADAFIEITSVSSNDPDTLIKEWARSRSEKVQATSDAPNSIYMKLRPKGLGLEDLILLDEEETDTEAQLVMREIASYINFLDPECTDPLFLYQEYDEEERELQIHMLHRVFHSSLAEFKEFFRGYYATPDNQIHERNLEEDLTVTELYRFLESLDWKKIFELCRRHCGTEVVASHFKALTGFDYASERAKYPVEKWDGTPLWATDENGRYIASE